ncbi:MAG: hypothetical protein QT02_C0002G0063 [archaeon GW2011_AR9]|nr:MAG: hypothetical protein QT02_C0002G0063 [archaeon GW2011_AR9]MBS3120607.1 PH domain-containing protein [Candidatus Woesearchaeota archaeon]HIG93021.1 PH domain-containing protein [Candidatus Woesearchaeota archaeon]HIH12483.1 PH domain-containing protein [Candidatus Woesearchaeota archaeon]
MTLEKDEQILMVLRKSRKAYLAEYLCGVIILGLLVGLAAKGVLLPALPRNLTLGFALFCLGFAEVKRLFLRYKITPTKVITIHGFIKQTKKNIYFHPLAFIPDINIQQSRAQRILNYGTVFLSGSGTGSLELKDVDSPQKVMEIIEGLIEQNKKSQTRTIPSSD